MSVNYELLRWILLILSAPLWWPFMRTLWRDFNGALREEGGLFGSPPRPSELEEIRRQKASEPDLLVSEPWAREQDRRHPRLKSPAPTRPGQATREPTARTPRRPPGGPRRFR